MNNKFKFSIGIVGFVIVVFFLHFLTNRLVSISITEKNLIKIHLFIILTTIIVIFLSSKILKNFPDKVGFGYMGLMLFKMIASIFFLFPFFSIKTIETKILVANFFSIYFIYLAVEAIVLLNIIKTKNF